MTAPVWLQINSCSSRTHLATVFFFCLRNSLCGGWLRPACQLALSMGRCLIKSHVCLSVPGFWLTISIHETRFGLISQFPLPMAEVQLVASVFLFVLEVVNLNVSCLLKGCIKVTDRHHSSKKITSHINWRNPPFKPPSENNKHKPKELTLILWNKQLKY